MAKIILKASRSFTDTISGYRVYRRVAGCNIPRGVYPNDSIDPRRLRRSMRLSESYITDDELKKRIK